VSEPPVYLETLHFQESLGRLVVRADAEPGRPQARAEREARVRRVLVARATEDRVRAALLQDASTEGEPEAPDTERVAPPVPSMEELLRPSPGVVRFLDSLGNRDR
jgi:hypothetical protein